MLRKAALLTLLFHAGICGAEPPSAAPQDNSSGMGFPQLPADARDVAERFAACNHFAGEINGDGGERDKEVFAKLTELSCDTIARDVATIRNKYANDAAVAEALKRASEF